MAAGVFQQRRALHQFQHQVGLALLHTGVQQAGDARVVQPRQDGAFTPEARGQVSAGQVGAQQLDGGLAVVQAIGPRCPPNLAHAPLAQGLHQPPGAKGVTRLVAGLGNLGLVGLQRLPQQGLKNGA